MTAREQLAGMFPSRTLGEEVADEILARHRAEVAEEFAARLEAFDRAEAAALVRSMADAATPTSKEPQR